MPRTTATDIDVALRHFDFEDFLVSNGADVEQKGSQIAGICPLCNHKRQSFYVNPKNGLWICHYCGERGGPVRLIQTVLDCSFADALELLCDNFVVFEDEKEIKEVTVEGVIELPAEFSPLADNDSIVARPYRRYAKRRGLNNTMLKQYDIGYAATGRYGGRLIVPVYHLGHLVNFVARAITEDNPGGKVLTPFGNEQYRYLFNLDNIWGTDSVMVMEGVFDALTLPEIAVASFGKKITDEQAALLKKAGVKNVTFCYDNDAISEAFDFAKKYWVAFRTFLIELPEGKDPNELGREEMLRIWEDTAVPVNPNGLRV